MLNKCFLLGNLTRDPELQSTSGGTAVCKMSIAVRRRFSESNEADFFNLTAWRGVAESCAKYLKKGSKIAVCGSLQNRSYEDKNGTKRTVTDIVAEEVEFLSPLEKSESTPKKGAHQVELTPVDDLDDLPF